MGIRDIIFRGKRIDNGEWIVSGSLRQWENGSVGLMTEYGMFKVVPETVGQYTGLTDKNGKKIFENDIVEYDEIKGTFYQIIWIQSGWGSREIDTNICELFPPMYTDNPTYFDNAKIVGNIHDNPELLEVE